MVKTPPAAATKATSPDRKAKSPDKKLRKKRKSPSKTPKPSINAPIDVVLPYQKNNAECCMLVQIDPQDATVLDFEGVTGAIGRMEADEDRITFDLKGYQYEGIIHPGPTAMVLALGKDKNEKKQLKMESMTDEFVTLQQTTDIMAKLDPSVLQGTMDEGYTVVDDDVNARSAQAAGQEEESNKNSSKGGDSKKVASRLKKAPSNVKKSGKIPIKMK